MTDKFSKLIGHHDIKVELKEVNPSIIIFEVKPFTQRAKQYKYLSGDSSNGISMNYQLHKKLGLEIADHLASVFSKHYEVTYPSISYSGIIRKPDKSSFSPAELVEITKTLRSELNRCLPDLKAQVKTQLRSCSQPSIQR